VCDTRKSSVTAFKDQTTEVSQTAFVAKNPSWADILVIGELTCERQASVTKSRAMGSATYRLVVAFKK
jgi:hypothetical protein